MSDKTYDVEIWREAARTAVDDTGTLRSGWMDDLQSSLSRMSKTRASALYSDICKLQLAARGELAEPPLLQILSDALVPLGEGDRRELTRFCTLVLDNGRVAERIADCVDLSPKARKAKWEQDQLAQRREAATHLAQATSASNFSAFLVRSRDDHERAYHAERAAISFDSSSKIDHWKMVLQSTPERLGRESKTFWYQLQTDRCNARQKAALCHKLDLCQRVSSCPQVIVSHRKRLLSELYALDNKERLPCRRQRFSLPAWLRRRFLGLSLRFSLRGVRDRPARG